MDHDQRFKTLIREHFEWFMELFFNEWATTLDFTQVEWLDKELYPDPPEGSEHVLDLVARVSLREGEAEATLVLVHIEIESPDRTTQLKPRLPYYYHFLRDKYQLPVLPVVVYLKVALDGIGVDAQVETFGSLEVTRFQYLYVGLPGLDAVQYLQGDNWLGVALSALMRIEPAQVAWLGAEALQRLSQAPLSTRQRRLLGECVEAYLPLTQQHAQEFKDLLLNEAYQGARAMNQTSYERGIDEGKSEGRMEGRWELIYATLEDRFGEVPNEVREAVRKLSLDEAKSMLLKIGTATSFSELGLPETPQDES